MDHKTLTFVTIGLIGFVLLVSLVIWLYFRLKRKKQEKNKTGFIFEEKVTKQLQTLAKKNEAIFLKGAIYHYDGNVFELDGILIYDSFIVIVEIKSYFGKMVGNGYEKDLTILNHNKSKKIPNPILQNERHITHVERFLGRNIPVVSLIIVPESTEVALTEKPNHVIFSTTEELDQKLLFLWKQSLNWTQKFNKQDVKNTIVAMQAKTSKERKKFKKLINKKG
ncbi:nuclease-related domain-containing protein [Mycoplasmopsis glycophila]|uniref:Nuclease-related domain n=1 Tax=Mycoplasmopsis glycophila TaxID=171285 RepID=A0A449AWE5_9BACT|nr:nuclease-related domain-containing protein [Mycoplasmopsis glycophila]VEU71038.1 Nuclease-related domain [Mycoplasmopsis glycophila]